MRTSHKPAALSGTPVESTFGSADHVAGRRLQDRRSSAISPSSRWWRTASPSPSAKLAGAFAIAFSYFAAELVARTVLHAYLRALRGSGDLKGYSWLQVVSPIVLAIFLAAILAARLTFGALDRLEDLIHAIGLAQVAALAIGCALAWARRKGVCSVFFGQNEGAGARDRVESGFYEAAKLLLVVQCIVLLAAIALVHGAGEVGLVDAEVRDHLTSYVAIVTSCFAFLSLSTIAIRLLNVLGRQAWAPTLSFVRCFVLTLPPMIFGNALWQVTGVFAGFALGNTIIGIASFLLALHLLKSDRPMRAPARRRNRA